MLRAVLIFSAVIAAAVGHSPNADKVEELVRSSPEGSYSQNLLEDAALDVPGLIRKYGYPVEVHNVVTSDGYIVQAHRIPYGRDRNNQPDSNKPVVFLMHGLLASSSDYIILGPGQSLGYILAEEGFDVWIGNSRGNFYSRRHISLDPDQDKSFWTFSWDEIGNYDLPAFIDYILQNTGKSKLHYVGHSQGGTTFLVLNSLRPEYNEKISSFQALAPAAFFINNENSIFNRFSPYVGVLETAASALGVGEILTDIDWLSNFVSTHCGEGSIFRNLCLSVLISDDNLNNFNSNMLPVFLGHTPAGASLRQVAHFAQSINSQSFRRYDYNAVRNLLVYGRLNPPDYNLAAVTAPTYLYYALGDDQVHYEDVKYLSDKLPNVHSIQGIKRPNFSHVDFVWASDAKAQLYENIIETLNKIENK